MTNRKQISTRARFEIFKRDGFTCQYCGAVPPHVILHIDHISPVSAGGQNSRDNLITACNACNLGKSNIPLSAVPQSLKDKAAEVAESEKQIKAYYKIIESRRARIENETWEICEIFDRNARVLPINKQWVSSIRRFIDVLGFPAVKETMHLATSRNPDSDEWVFRYFCGICWNKIREADHG